MFSFKVCSCAVLATVSLMNIARAGEGPVVYPYQGQQVNVPGMATTPVTGNAYPQLNAPLYPSPVQYTPPWNGGTIVTNQAFAPHETLYPHTYHAMYPPFYYKVKGGWIWTPFGIRQHEQWKLQGTEVLVKYREHPPLFSGFHPRSHR